MKKGIGYVAALLIMGFSFVGLMGCITSSSNGENDSGITALELAVLMGNGINLSNTMEAYGHLSHGVNRDPKTYETLWGQPVTTQAMITAMKKSGFDSIRIPVAWTNTMDFEKGDYTISGAYSDRVEEIVKYALNADMYVVINDHWDGSWWGMFGSATQKTRNQAMELYIAMWTQIAEKFKDYSYKVIFESANEELGDRLNDVHIAKDSGTLSKDECYETTNKINQTFVNTIRGSGGNNTERFLLIAGYNTNIKATCDDRFKMPVDIINDKLLISVHYYDPWSYCGTDSITRWGSIKEHSHMNNTLEKITKFTKKGYGVILGEWGPGPILADGARKDNITDYHRNFLDNCDLYGYVPMLWDTGGYFNRTKLRITDKKAAALYKERSLSAQSSLSRGKIKAQAMQSMNTAMERAKDYKELGPTLSGDGKAVGWIMYNSNDWQITYSVGDQYDPNSITAGVVASDVEITGAGTYTVSLDFTNTKTGYANSVGFSALGISNGELLFPGYIITIKEILINGEPYELIGIPYTTADDGLCTRVNLYNNWVEEISPEARTADGDVSDLSAVIIDKETLGKVEAISVTFEYGPGE